MCLTDMCSCHLHTLRCGRKLTLQMQRLCVTGVLEVLPFLPLLFLSFFLAAGAASPGTSASRGAAAGSSRMIQVSPCRLNSSDAFRKVPCIQSLVQHMASSKKRASFSDSFCTRLTSVCSPSPCNVLLQRSRWSHHPGPTPGGPMVRPGHGLAHACTCSVQHDVPDSLKGCAWKACARAVETRSSHMQQYTYQV